MLPGGGPWEKELRGSETSAHVSGGDSGPDPERASAKARTWVSSRRQEEGDQEGVRAGTEEATLAAGVGLVRAVWASDEVPAPHCGLLSSPPCVALLCPGSSNQKHGVACLRPLLEGLPPLLRPVTAQAPPSVLS